MSGVELKERDAIRKFETDQSNGHQDGTNVIVMSKPLTLRGRITRTCGSFRPTPRL